MARGQGAATAEAKEARIDRLLARASDSKGVEADRIKAFRRLRKLWRAQIARFERAHAEERTRYRAAPGGEDPVSRDAPPDGRSLFQNAQPDGLPLVRKGWLPPQPYPTNAVWFERREISRADYVLPRLDQFFADVGREALASEDPVKAMRQYLGLISPLGRPLKDVVKGCESIEEEVELIYEVRCLLGQGLSKGAALDRLTEDYATAGDRKKPGWEYVVKARLKKQYERALKSKAVRAALAAKAFDWCEAQQDEGTETNL